MLLLVLIHILSCFKSCRWLVFLFFVGLYFFEWLLGFGAFINFNEDFSRIDILLLHYGSVHPYLVSNLWFNIPQVRGFLVVLRIRCLVILLILGFNVVALGLLLLLLPCWMTSVLWGGSHLLILLIHLVVSLIFLASVVVLLPLRLIRVYFNINDGVSFLVRGFKESCPVPLRVLDIPVKSFGCIFYFLEIFLQSHRAFCNRILEDVILRIIQ